ncbi:VWA domain-containing protein, partial [Dolichospermum sp. ST_sed3]|nr:VWA domain-containing protein [Dolichospermum sp. ST_sed3]
EELYICTINHTDALKNNDVQFSSYDAHVTIVDDKGSSFAVPLNSVEKGTVAIIAKIINTGFMGAKLINENRVIDLKTFQTTIPGANNLTITSKMVLLQKKMEKSAPQLVKLAKKADAILKKVNLSDHRAKVALCLDISGSMGNLYLKGKIQRFAEKVLALGCRFDDDGAIDVFLFGMLAHDVGEMTLDNFPNFINNIIDKYPLEGGTNYGKVIQQIRNHYFPDGRGMERKTPFISDMPVYVMFLTDGATMDESDTRKQMIYASKEPIFWQFMGIGKSSKNKGKGFLSSLVPSYNEFAFLEKLDTMAGRYVDNANFFSVEDPETVSDEELYGFLMTEYPGWLKLAKEKKLLK